MPHMYNDPCDEQTAFGGVKKRTYESAEAMVKRMKEVLDDPTSTDFDRKEARKRLIDNDLVKKHHRKHGF